MNTPRATRDSKIWWPFAAILFIAAFLRTPQLDGPRFHPDEALFASFARAIAVWHDPMLAHAPVDKPPLLFYLQALCYPFLGPREMAARLPNYYASILTVALTAAVIFKLLRKAHIPNSVQAEHQTLSTARIAALIAGLFVALSPLAVGFGPTAFTDPLMVMWAMAALLAATGGRPAWAGFWLGLGLATKYQALLFAPLVLFFLYQAGHTRKLAACTRFLALAGVPVAIAAAWDLARVGSFSLIGKQISGYGGLHLVPIYDLLPRLLDWFKTSWFIAGSAVLGLFLVSSITWWVFRGISEKNLAPLDKIGFTIAGWLLAYATLHWILNIQVWDRYLLPVVPMAAILIGLAVLRFSTDAGSIRAKNMNLLVLLIILLLPAAIGAMEGELPIGGDHGTNEGIDQVAGYFARHPYGTVLYDHWLSWELRYYLFDSRVYISWFPDPAGLVTDLEAFSSRSARYIVIPAWVNPQDTLEPVQQSGFQVERVFTAYRSDQSESFIIWKITNHDDP
ncbi:MAG: hypothetical protein JXA42_04315 [Anaerolineales bacterium]|nr:hypothetical protein [Anaerolineales bacterium]